MARFAVDLLHFYLVVILKQILNKSIANLFLCLIPFYRLALIGRADALLRSVSEPASGLQQPDEGVAA